MVKGIFNLFECSLMIMSCFPIEIQSYKMGVKICTVTTKRNKL